MYVAPTELWLFYFLMLLTCGTAGAGIQNLLVHPSSGQHVAALVTDTHSNSPSKKQFHPEDHSFLVTVLV
jgi:hypothetical protein